MKKFLRDISTGPSVSAEVTCVGPGGSNTLAITGDRSEPVETFDVFFELACGMVINLIDSEGNRYEYWFPCIISKKPGQVYRIVTSSRDKDLLTLTIIGRSQVIRRYLEIDFSRE